MFRAGRPTVAPNALASNRHRLAELRRRDDRVMPSTKVLGVAVDVLATMSEWHLVVDHRRQGNQAFVVTHLTKTVRSVHATLTLLLTGATPKSVVRFGSLPRLAFVCQCFASPPQTEGQNTAPASVRASTVVYEYAKNITTQPALPQKNIKGIIIWLQDCWYGTVH